MSRPLLHMHLERIEAAGLVAGSLDAQQRIATDVSELRARATFIEQILRTGAADQVKKRPRDTSPY